MWSASGWAGAFAASFAMAVGDGEATGRYNVNKTSGIVSGTMKMASTGSVSWKGVALPGEKQGVIGAWWRSVLLPYKDAKGEQRKRSVNAGGLVEIP